MLVAQHNYILVLCLTSLKRKTKPALPVINIQVHTEENLTKLVS